MFLINAPRVIITANFYAFVYKFRVLCYLCTSFISMMSTMKKSIRIISICSILAAFMFACYEWERDRPDDENPDLLKVKEAKAWFESTQSAVMLFGQKDSASSLKSGRPGKRIKNQTYWNFAKEKHNSLFSVVEVPVYSNVSTYIIHGGSPPKDLEDFPGITRLVIRKNLQTGVTDAFVLTFTGDSAYVSQPDFKKKLFKNRFVKRKSDFNGTEVISSLEGDFIAGYIIENGKRVARFGMPDQESFSPRIGIKSTYICGQEEIWLYYWKQVECTGEPDEVPEDIELSGYTNTTICSIKIWYPVYVPIYCEYNEPTEPCYDDCTCYGINCGSGNNNNGGNNNTPLTGYSSLNNVITTLLNQLKTKKIAISFQILLNQNKIIFVPTGTVNYAGLQIYNYPNSINFLFRPEFVVEANPNRAVMIVCLHEMYHIYCLMEVHTSFPPSNWDTMSPTEKKYLVELIQALDHTAQSSDTDFLGWLNIAFPGFTNEEYDYLKYAYAMDSSA